MSNVIDISPVTKHGDGTVSGTNANNLGLIPKKNTGNKFLDKYNDERKTETEQLLQGIPEFVIKDLCLYFLFDNYPKKTNYYSGMLETFIRQLNLKHIKEVKMFDMVQWCKCAIRSREEGITSGEPFLECCDEGYDRDFGYLDIVNHVKKEMPIDDYLKGMTPEKTMEYLSESSFNYMLKRISKNKFLFEQCEDYIALQNLITGLQDGKDYEEDYLQLKKRIEQNRQKYYRINSSSSTVSALDRGFTANLKEDECRAENQRNLRLEEEGANKFKFGHRWLNLVTGGGLESKQLMVYGAPSGNGKTTMMISSTIDMALYNGETVKYKKGLEPCILYISAETGLNDIKGRYIKMMTGVDVSWDDELTGEKRRLTNEQIEDELVKASEILQRRTPIKIRFIQVPNNSYSKKEIMRDIELLRENENLQVVGLVADYIKGFKPEESTTDMRIRIENVVSDLRAIAIEYDCAVITASQVKVDVSNKISENRSKCCTSVIPKDTPDTVFSETKGINDVCDFGIVFAQTSNKYERNQVTKSVKYTHLEALVVKTRAGGHNNARAFIPYVEGSQIAFEKDVDLLDESGRPVWLTSGDLEFIGDENLLQEEMNKAKGMKGLFKGGNKPQQLVSAECNISRERNDMDDLPTFYNPDLQAVA